MHIQTVTGSVRSESITIADAHAHVWIDPPVAAPSQIHLHDEDAIEAELRDFAAAGGSLLVELVELAIELGQVGLKVVH